MNIQTVHNSMMQKAAALQKQAISDIPTEWKKYLTEDERQTTADAIYRFQETGATAGEKTGLILSSIPNIVAGPVGMIAAGFTPSYTAADMKALGNDENFSTKASWIPGYLHYKAIKTQAAIDRIFKKVRERRAAERTAQA